jgi:hypothetical protein
MKYKKYVHKNKNNTSLNTIYLHTLKLKYIHMPV